jgi:hypothetical protein
MFKISVSDIIRMKKTLFSQFILLALVLSSLAKTSTRHRHLQEGEDESSPSLVEGDENILVDAPEEVSEEDSEDSEDSEASQEEQEEEGEGGDEDEEQIMHRGIPTNLRMYSR